MLSTFAVRSGSFASSLLKGQATKVWSVSGSRSMSDSLAKQVKQWDEANEVFYGKQRDTQNFPHPVQPEKSGPVRLGFVPEEFFTTMYEKTGVTGPYLFGVGLVTTLLSKEIWVVDHGFAEVIGFYGAIWFLTSKVGAGMGKWMDTKNQLVAEENFVKPVQAAKSAAEETVKTNELAVWQEEGQQYLWESKKENVALQLESEYRQRLASIFKAVKSRMDYHIEIESAKRRFEQQHMVNWIVNSVRSSITPQQEAESIKSCIAQLRSLSQRSGTPTPGPSPSGAFSPA